MNLVDVELMNGFDDLFKGYSEQVYVLISGVLAVIKNNSRALYNYPDDMPIGEAINDQVNMFFIGSKDAVEYLQDIFGDDINAFIELVRNICSDNGCREINVINVAAYQIEEEAYRFIRAWGNNPETVGDFRKSIAKKLEE